VLHQRVTNDRNAVHVYDLDLENRAVADDFHRR
jgi:hypothetical protein